MEKKYYEAYDDRYRAVHAKGVSWLSDRSTPIVLDTIGKYGVSRTDAILEIGCGEGRDARAVLDGGYGLLATDISEEAVSFCRKRMPAYESSFRFWTASMAAMREGTISSTLWQSFICSY